MKKPMTLSSARIPGLDCRLLYLVGGLSAGGLEKQLYYLLKAMDRERYKPMVAVWSYNENDTYVRQIRDLGVQMFPIPGAFSRVAKLLSFRRLLRKLRPEVIHSYSFHTNFAAMWASIGLNPILIGSIRNDFLSEYKEAGRLVGKLSALWPRTQICNSLAAQRNMINRKGPFKPKSHRVVHNGLDIDQFTYVPMLPKETKLLAVGSLNPRKRWDRLIRVIALASAKGLAFKVYLVGAGPMRKQLELQAKELGVEAFIEFLGYQADIATLLEQSTFLIHTADHEGCPNVVMEAMASGRAVVATDAGDVPFLVEDGKTGFVVSRGDDDMLLERMSALINDHELCRQMGEAGRAKAEQEFGLDRLVFETFAAYGAAGWKDV